MACDGPGMSPLPPPAYTSSAACARRAVSTSCYLPPCRRALIPIESPRESMALPSSSPCSSLEDSTAGTFESLLDGSHSSRPMKLPESVRDHIAGLPLTEQRSCTDRRLGEVGTTARESAGLCVPGAFRHTAEEGWGGRSRHACSALRSALPCGRRAGGPRFVSLRRLPAGIEAPRWARTAGPRPRQPSATRRITRVP
jgi:hypothetical protein